MLVNRENPAARWALATLAIALLGAAACEVPTSYDVEMGKQVEIRMDAATPAPSPDDLLTVLRDAKGVNDASVSASTRPDGARVLVYVWGYDLDADALVAGLRGRFEQLAQAQVSVRPLEGTIHGKLGDRLGETLFDVHVSGDTADEIRAEILAQLAAQGFTGDATVDVQTDGDTRTISISTSTDTDANGATGQTQDVTVQRK